MTTNEGGNMRVEWASRYDFAEVAEALGVGTDRIMATVGGTVLYTPEGDDDSIWRARVARGADGVLFTYARVFVGTVAEFHARMHAALGAQGSDE